MINEIIIHIGLFIVIVPLPYATHPSPHPLILPPPKLFSSKSALFDHEMLKNFVIVRNHSRFKII